MLKENCKVGMRVLFGRGCGEKTIGIVRKLNPSKAKVETLEARGSRSEKGQQWGVPYEMMEPCNHPAPGAPGVALAVPKSQAHEPIPYSMFDSVVTHIMCAINCIYGDLSPENLSCDGELSATQVRQKRSVLDRQLRGLFAALGREVSEEVAWKWHEEHEATEKRYRRRQA